MIDVVLVMICGNIFYLLINKVISKAERQSGEKILTREYIVRNFFDASAFIGYFERIIMFIALNPITNPTSGVGALSVLIAIKSFVRYPEIKKGDNNTVNAEKFLFGTLCSIVWVLIVIYITNKYNI